MNVGVFEKISDNQFKKDFSEIDIKILHDLILPKRATKGSAGYDFFAPFEIKLEPNETIKVPTGIRVFIEEGWFLGIFPRSSLGFKYKLRLDNTVGIIDSDYFFANNEGHIFIKMTNCNPVNTIVIPKGEAFAQGIFIPYGLVYEDKTSEVRHGGIGSTNKR